MKKATDKKNMNDIIPYKESVNVEFKTHCHPSIGSVISAFLNTIGGTIYIGMAERHVFSGANENDEKLLHQAIKDISPNPNDYIRIEKNIRFGKPIIVVAVQRPESGTPFSFHGKVYYRIGDVNRIASTDTKVSLLQNRRVALGLPLMTDYYPTDKEKSAIFKQKKEENNVQYKRLGSPSKNTAFFYKYLSLDVALTIFRKKFDKEKQKEVTLQTIRFVEPPHWDDQYESRFYSANYGRVKNNSGNTPKLYATCFTPREESEPAWQIYNRDKDGIGKRCVQFKLNQLGLRQELVNNLKNCMIVEGRVEYKSKHDIRTLHLSTNENGSHSKVYDKYFSSFTLDNYINLLLLKRTAFEHEQEVRIFIIFDDNKSSKALTKDDAKYKDIHLNWLYMLEGIKVDPKCSDIEMELLQDEINQLIEDSSISEKDALKNKLKVTKYDVNKDEGRKDPITIGETFKEFSDNIEKNKKTNMPKDYK